MDSNPYKTTRILYVAGPSATGKHLSTMRKHTVRLWELIGGAKYVVICPYFNGYQLEVDCLVPPEEIEERQLALLRCADALYLLPDWQASRSASRARALAQELGLPVFQTLGEARRALEQWPLPVGPTAEPSSTAPEGETTPSAKPGMLRLYVDLTPQEFEQIQKLLGECNA